MPSHLIPIIIPALLGAISQPSPNVGWDGEWRCDMSWDYQGRFVDGSLSYILVIQKENVDYSVSIEVQGSRRWSKIKAFAQKDNNKLTIYFDSYSYKSNDFEWNFKKNDVLFTLINKNKKVITTWHAFKPDIPELSGFLPPGQHFIRQK